MVFCAQAQQPVNTIQLNQVGFYPSVEKLAVVVGEPKESTFYVKTSDGKKIVFTGKLTASKPNEFSQKPIRIADFSSFKTNGTYVVEIPGIGTSYPFQIQRDVHKAAAASLKGFYYQRVSTDLPEKYAGKWHRPAGHATTDNQVLIHPSAASAQRPAGTMISAPRGWYDAGDYNKYIVNSGITMGTLLAAYEDFPEYFKAQKLTIPESANQVPDILDEVLWNLRWMLTMQDPNDGGVYHKLTNAAFDGMIMPDKAVKPRYVVQKSTAAALDFAAVMAQASRVYKNFNRDFPGLSDSCLNAAVKAWEWSQKNPNILYEQESINKQFDPKITTGTYGDRNVSDEWTWAGAELYVTTKKDNYYTAAKINTANELVLPSWAQVKTLGYYTLARNGKNLTPAAQKDLPGIKKQIIQFADDLLAGTAERTYRTVMGKSEKDYIWGSSAVAANQGIALIQAYKLANNKKYLQGALGNLDYLLGRNAVGYSFLTGFGEKSTLHPHHRPSIADGIEEPVPGLLSGGTNARAKEQDKCPGYAATSPDEVYLDQDCSYASNEIAINWNSPFVYLVSALEALQNQMGYTAANK
nr:glycoside hydrolase family 9 protein [Adhaeribacter arboris]